MKYRKYIDYFFRRLISPSAALQQTVTVTDVSFWQEDRVDFARMKADGVAGVIIRAGQNLWEDVQFRNNWAKAKAAGLPRGAYYFLDSRAKGSQQADLMHGLLKDDPPELMAVGDYEENYNGPYGGWNLPYDFFERMKSLGWRSDQLWMYSGYYYWQEHKPTTQASLDYFKQYELWLAWYTNDPSRVLVPPPWPKISLWQYTDVSPYGGDKSWFNGSLEDFKVRFNLGGTTPPPPPPPPPPTEDAMFVGTVLVNLNVRSSPSGTVIGGTGYLKPGDLISASVIENGWWKMVAIRRAGASVALPGNPCYAYEGSTGAYIRKEFTVEGGAPVNVLPDIALHAEGYPDIEWLPLP